MEMAMEMENENGIVLATFELTFNWWATSRNKCPKK